MPQRSEPALSSAVWAANFNLTKAYGEQNSTVRTAAAARLR